MTELLLAPLQVLSIFVAYPWFAAVIGALFVTLGWRARRWWVVTVGVVWVLYAAYETGMHQRWLCSGECNIRVDLLLIYPILLLASAGAAMSLRRAVRHGAAMSRADERTVKGQRLRSHG